MLNVINGGAHAANSIDLQEFMVVPAGAECFSEAMRLGAEVYHSLKQVLTERGLATGVGDEGGFAPDLASSEAAIEAILEAAERAGHLDRVAIALDPASSEVFRDGVYRFEGREKTSAELLEFWAGSSAASRSSRSRTALAEDDWDAGGRSPSGSATAAARRRRPVRHEPVRLQAGIEAESPTRSWSRSTRSAP